MMSRPKRCFPCGVKSPFVFRIAIFNNENKLEAEYQWLCLRCLKEVLQNYEAKP